MEQGDIHGGAYKRLDMGKSEDEVRMRPDKKKKKKMTYDEIKAEREKNEEFMTGKKYKKNRGAMGKLHRKKKGKKK